MKACFLVHLVLLSVYLPGVVPQASTDDAATDTEAGCGTGDETCEAYLVPAKPTPTTHSLRSIRGPRMATRVWPVEDPKALVVIVHGGGWHSGYFGELAASLNERDVFVAAYDQVGLGYSEGEPAPAPEGYYHVQKLEDVVDDLYSAITWAKLEAGKENLPLFLISESAGAPIALAGALDKKNRSQDIAGVVSMGGLLRIGQGMLPPTPVVKILLFLARFFPRVRMPATDTGATFDEAFGDRKWGAVARSDPAVMVTIPATLGAASVLLGTGETIIANGEKLDTPFLAVHGRNDVRTQLSAVQELVDKAPDAEIEVLQTDGHQLLQDVPKIKNAAIARVANWIQGRLE